MRRLLTDYLPWRPLDELWDDHLSATSWNTWEWFEDEDEELEVVTLRDVPGEWDDVVWMELLWRSSCENLRARDPELEPVTCVSRHLPEIPGRLVRG